MARYVDIECDAVTELIGRVAFKSRDDIQSFLDNIPTADVVEAPCKCGECKYSTEGRDWINRLVYKCHRFKITGRDYDDFCSCGERKTENDL